MARGSITPQDGTRGRTYKVRYDVPDPATGVRRQRAKSFKTRREAERFLAKTQHALDSNTYISDQRITVAALCERYLTATRSFVRDSTHLARVGIVNTHLLPLWGDARASALTTIAVQDGVDRLSRTRAPQTVRNIFYLLSRIYRQAVRWQLVPTNPCGGVVLPKPRQVRGGAVWSAADAACFLAQGGVDPLFPIYRLILMTGMRRSEALALRWGDIDLGGGRVVVRGSLVRESDQHFHPGPVKTRASGRAIALDAETLAMLRELREAARFAPDPEGWVFADERPGHGGHHNPERVGKRFVRLVADLVDADGKPLPSVTLHDLRHTHASLLAEAGVDLRTIMERLGHGTPNMTLGRYMHGSVEQDRRAAESLSRLVAPPADPTPSRDRDRDTGS